MTDWSAILAEHGDRVWRTIFRLLNHHADAHDCYQETFVAAWKLIGDRPFKDWAPMLTCMAARKAIDRLRQRKRLSAIRAMQPSDDAVDCKCSFESLEANELRDRIRAALALLPEKQAEVFWLRCIEELSAHETAEQMKISSGEVRVLLHRSRIRLANILKFDEREGMQDEQSIASDR